MPRSPGDEDSAIQLNASDRLLRREVVRMRDFTEADLVAFAAARAIKSAQVFDHEVAYGDDVEIDPRQRGNP